MLLASVCRIAGHALLPTRFASIEHRDSMGKLRSHWKAGLVYVVLGALNNLLGYAVFVLLVLGGLSNASALFMATALAILSSYFTTGRVVFGARNTRRLPHYIGGRFYILCEPPDA